MLKYLILAGNDESFLVKRHLGNKWEIIDSNIKRIIEGWKNLVEELIIKK